MQTGHLDSSSSFATGNASLFNTIYYKHHQAVYANILKTVRQTEAAEDILQDVFVALWENRATIDVNRVANWLFVVSFNKSVSFLKKKTKESLVTIAKPESLEGIADGGPTEEDHVETLLKILEEAIEKLSPRRKEIFNLSRIQGLSQQEIALQLDISIATVKDHLTLSNRQIRSYILYFLKGQFVFEIRQITQHSTERLSYACKQYYLAGVN